ncbi:hypothetical protein [Corallococcus interemptor]|uniref:hypothetical protein n=1 Tax=Corallococcus interemptor TaxID=2316720 RepID=UPI0011C48820|nr:hypothetical protein [Corallococcus interemptor]
MPGVDADATLKPSVTVAVVEPPPGVSIRAHAFTMDFGVMTFVMATLLLTSVGMEPNAWKPMSPVVATMAYVRVDAVAAVPSRASTLTPPVLPTASMPRPVPMPMAAMP